MFDNREHHGNPHHNLPADFGGSPSMMAEPLDYGAKVNFVLHSDNDNRTASPSPVSAHNHQHRLPPQQPQQDVHDVSSLLLLAVPDNKELSMSPLRGGGDNASASASADNNGSPSQKRSPSLPQSSTSATTTQESPSAGGGGGMLSKSMRFPAAVIDTGIKQPVIAFFATAALTWSFAQCRLIVARWLFNTMPWVRADSTSTTTSTASSSTLWTKLSACRGSSWKLPHFVAALFGINNSASSATSGLVADSAEGQDEDIEVIRRRCRLKQEREDIERAAAKFQREVSAITERHWLLYALSLGVIPKWDCDLMQEIRTTISTKPCPPGWKMEVSAAQGCGIRYLDPKHGARHLWHGDNEFALDMVHKEAQRRTREQPLQRKRELARLKEQASTLTFGEGGSAVFVPAAAASAGVDDLLGNSGFAGGASSSSFLPLAVAAANDDDDDDGGIIIEEDDTVFAALQQTESPQRLCRLNTNTNNNIITNNMFSNESQAASPQRFVPPQTAFDLTSPRARSNEIPAEATAHVDQLLDHFSCGGGRAAAAPIVFDLRSPLDLEGSFSNRNIRGSAARTASVGSASKAEEAAAAAVRDSLLVASQQQQLLDDDNDSNADDDVPEGGESSQGASGQPPQQQQHQQNSILRKEHSFGSPLVYSSSMRDHVSPSAPRNRKAQQQ